MQNNTNNIDDRIINISSISEIEEKLLPIFQIPQYKSYVINLSSTVATHLFKFYHTSNDKHPPGFTKFVKSLRQRECYKDGTAWTRTQILSFIIDCMTEEILQAKIGRPTDATIGEDEIHIDDMQTRWTHYTSFKEGDSNYEFTAQEIRDIITMDEEVNMGSLRDIKEDLEELINYLEDKTNPLTLKYDLLKHDSVLKLNFDNVIFSCNLRIKPNSYLAKQFINDNMSSTTLTTSQILMTRGTILPNEEYSFTETIRPIIDLYNGRNGSNNDDNQMFNGMLKKPKAFSKKSWITKGGRNTGQVNDLMLGQILSFQNSKGKLDKKKKVWEYNGLPTVLKSWRQLVHTTDKPYEQWVSDRFKNAKLTYNNDREDYTKKSTEIVKAVNDICYSVVNDKNIINELDKFKNFFTKEYNNRKNNKDKHPTLSVLNMFGFANTENAKLLIHELVRNSFTYNIDILTDDNGVLKSRFVLEYVKTMNEVIRNIYTKNNKVDDKKINDKLTHAKNPATAEYGTTYEARLPIWIEIYDETEKCMKDNSIFKHNYGGTRNVKKSERDKLLYLFDKAYNEAARIMTNDILYFDPEWGNVTKDDFQDGHTISNKNYGSATLSTSVVIHGGRNEKAGSSTKGNTTLPKPEEFYTNVINGLNNHLTIPTISKEEKTKCKASIDVLEQIVEWYNDGDVK
jgi:hypothetical protein